MAGVGNGGQSISATRFAELTGVTRERLRTWERRFGFPRPVRHAGGPRRYAVEDVARVVAVRRASEDGAPLAVAIERATAAASAPPRPPARAFRAAVELAPVPVALLSGPVPLVVAHANARLRAIAGPGGASAALAAFEDAGAAAVLRGHFARDLPAAELGHPGWGPDGTPARSVAYRLPVGPGERPLVALVGTETAAEREAHGRLAAAEGRRTAAERRLEALRRRSERHERWLDALAALAQELRREPGPDVVGSALDVLVGGLHAIDGAIAAHAPGRLVLRESRRGVLASRELTVAAHPELGHALGDGRAVWLDRPAARLLGLPDDLHAAGVPVTVAGETLGVLVMAFDEVEPHDDDNARLLAAISAALGFAMLRDRLVRELRAAVSPGPGRGAPPRPRGAGGRSPGG